MPYVEVYIDQSDIDEIASDACIDDFDDSDLIEELKRRNYIVMDNKIESVISDMYIAKSQDNSADINNLLSVLFWEVLKRKI